MVVYDAEYVASQEDRVRSALKGATSLIVSRVHGTVFNIQAPQKETGECIAVIANLNYPFAVMMGKKPRPDCFIRLNEKDYKALKSFVIGLTPNVKVYL